MFVIGGWTKLTFPRNVNATVVSLEVSLNSKWSSVNGTIITNPDVNGIKYKNNATAITPQPLNMTSSTLGVDGSWSCNAN